MSEHTVIEEQKQTDFNSSSNKLNSDSLENRFTIASEKPIIEKRNYALPILIFLIAIGAICFYRYSNSSYRYEPPNAMEDQTNSNSNDNRAEVAAFVDACSANICDGISLINQDAPFYYSCCDFMIINGAREYFKSENEFEWDYISLKNNNWSVFIRYDILNCDGMVCCSMEGTMEITNLRTNHTDSYQVKGDVNCN